jgi:hypothetical protein
MVDELELSDKDKKEQSTSRPLGHHLKTSIMKHGHRRRRRGTS